MSTSTASIDLPPTADVVGRGAERLDVEKIRRDSVRGGVVTVGSGVASVTIRLISTIFLARMLAPADFGVVAMVTAVTAFVGLFRDLGLSSATIQKRDLTHGQQCNLFWINVGTGLLLTAITAAMAPAIAAFYGRPDLQAVTLALAPTFVIGSIAAQPCATMTRELMFGRLAIADIAGSLTILLATLGMAFAGMGYWSLVWGGLVGGLVSTFIAVQLSPFRPGLWDRNSQVGDFLRFGVNVTLFGVADYAHRNFDNIAIGRVWGAEVLGVYGRAYSLLMIPIQAVRGPILSVSYPALSKLQDRPFDYRAYVRDVAAILALLSMPLFAFIAVCSTDFVEVLLGSQWHEAAPIVKWLSIAGFFQTTGTIRGVVMMSSGNSARVRDLGFFQSLAMLAVIAASVAWGAVAVAASYAIAQALLFIPMTWYAFRDSHVSLAEVCKTISGCAAASVLASAALLTLPHFLDFESPSTGVRLAFDLVIFTIVFAAIYAMTPTGRNSARKVTTLIRGHR
jgi:O-antigen/teichoic acid export membrane protein